VRSAGRVHGTSRVHTGREWSSGIAAKHDGEHLGMAAADCHCHRSDYRICGLMEAPISSGTLRRHYSDDADPVGVGAGAVSKSDPARLIDPAGCGAAGYAETRDDRACDWRGDSVAFVCLPVAHVQDRYDSSLKALLRFVVHIDELYDGIDILARHR